MKTLTVQELKAKMDQAENFQLIDIRERYEAEICSIGGELIPLSDIDNQTEKIRRDIPVVLYCRSGVRSAALLQALEKRGYDNIYNLTGGILAWADQIDPAMQKY